MGWHRIHPTARHVFCRHTLFTHTLIDSVQFKLSWFPKLESDTWWMDRLWSQLPDPRSFYVLSLNSHFSGVDLRKRGPESPDLCNSCFAQPRYCLLQALQSTGQHVCATHFRFNNKGTFHFYVKHLKPSLHVKQSSHLRGGQAPGG